MSVIFGQVSLYRRESLSYQAVAYNSAFLNGCGNSCNNHDVYTDRHGDFIFTVSLTDNPLCPVTFYGIADFLTRSDAETVIGKAVFPDVNHHFS